MVFPPLIGQPGTVRIKDTAIRAGCRSARFREPAFAEPNGNLRSRRERHLRLRLEVSRRFSSRGGLGRAACQSWRLLQSIEIIGDALEKRVISRACWLLLGRNAFDGYGGRQLLVWRFRGLCRGSDCKE